MMSETTKQQWQSMVASSKAKGEHNDCTVKALTAATGLPYDQCHAALAKHGRKHRKGCHFASVGKKAAADLGFLMETLLPVLPLELNINGLSLSLFSVMSTFGTPQAITTDEMTTLQALLVTLFIINFAWIAFATCSAIAGIRSRLWLETVVLICSCRPSAAVAAAPSMEC